MFNLSKIKNTYNWTITVHIPSNNGFEKIKTKVIYNRLPHQERMAILDQASKLDENIAEFDATTDSLFAKVFAGWEDGQIKDEDGNDLVADADGIAKVLGITEFRNALLKGYFDSSGGEALKAGN